METLAVPLPSDARDRSAAAKKSMASVIVFVGLILACWAFPRLWYVGTNSFQGRHWLQEQSAVPGWTYTPLDVGKAAEAILVADSLVNGEFARSDGTVVRVFSSKRFKENQHELGLFVHTPDRCWTQSGWSVEVVLPDTVDVDIHGVLVRCERRVFTSPSGVRELVYFAGFVGGQPLPYRLDHNLSVALRQRFFNGAVHRASASRASSSTMWRRLWDSFINRRQLLGPKQFIRISTPLGISQPIERGDELLRDLLPRWLVEKPYDSQTSDGVASGVR